MKQGPERGHFSRSRSLAKFNEKFGPKTLEKAIDKALQNQKTVRVLEIGCGEGRVLMELRKLFPQIELYGINKKPWAAMKGKNSLKKTALFYKIFTPTQLKTIKLPEILFYDVSDKLKFKDNYFDVVYSQVAIQYVKDKAHLFEEIWRVLKKQGQAYINFDTFNESFPDFLQNQSTPRFVIYQKNKVVPVKKFLNDFKNKGYSFKYSSFVEIDADHLKKKRYNLTITKNKPRLKLNLKLDEISSFNIGLLNQEKEDCIRYWGYRSVYQI